MSVEGIRYREEAELKEWMAIEEKGRISREVHDGIGGSFVKAMLLSDMVMRGELGCEEALKDLKKTLSEGLDEMRGLIWSVDDSMNTLGDLISNITERTQPLRGGMGIFCRVHPEIDNETLHIPPSIKLNTIRFIQESLTNAIKHAKATRIAITVTQSAEQMTIGIKDNGRGFDISNPNPGGHGLKNMQRRCDEMGARLNIILSTSCTSDGNN